MCVAKFVFSIVYVNLHVFFFKMSMKKLVALFIVFLAFFFVNHAAFANDYTVVNTNDSGAGSLRQAIADAVASPVGTDRIIFNIPTVDPGYDTATGVWTIRPLSDLPLIYTGNITIDGTTQPNHNPDGPEILIDGSEAALNAGFQIVASNICINGLAVGGFQYGFLFAGTSVSGSSVTNNYIGVLPDGHTPLPNQYGIGLSTYASIGAAHRVTIADNLISGNSMAGIALVSVHEINVVGNKIGTDHTGLLAVPNGQGIYLTASYNNVIGGNELSTRNLISGNTGAAIVLDGNGTRANSVQGNYIGVDVSGAAPLGNHYGIVIQTNANGNIIGGNTSGERNIISANSEIGIYVESSDSNVVSGNFIGPDATGHNAFYDGNDSLIQANGVELNTTAQHNVIGGSSVMEHNVISGNRVYGVILYGNAANNCIEGNFIGLDITGDVAMPNATGICVDGGANHNTMKNNVLSGNKSYGLFIVSRNSDANIFIGNLVGTDAGASYAIPNDVGLMLAVGCKNNVIGGGNFNDRNVFSGNRYAGIEVVDAGTSQNHIEGNLIGVGPEGNMPIPNAMGVVVSANVDSLFIVNNVISGNTRMGLAVTDAAHHIFIQRNKIGIGLDGVAAVGNGGAGIVLNQGAHDNLIGGEGAGNIIAHNDSAGIVIMDASTVNNRISQNSIFNNQYLGIDIFPWGVNQNDDGDGDSGANGLMNLPEIVSATYNPNTSLGWVTGTLNTMSPENCVVEIYVAEPEDFIWNNGEGRTFLASVRPDADGHWSAAVSGIAENDVLTATATDSAGNTSEFAANLTTMVSIQEFPNLSENNLLLFPNPTYSHLSIQSDDIQCVTIFNSCGGMMERIEAVSASHIQLDLSDYSAGMYILQIATQEGVFTKKVIKR